MSFFTERGILVIPLSIDKLHDLNDIKITMKIHDVIVEMYEAFLQ